MTFLQMLRNILIFISKALLNFSIFGTMLLILRYVDRDLFAALIYYSDPHVLLTDSTGYIFFYMLAIIPLLFILMIVMCYLMVEVITYPTWKNLVSLVGAVCLGTIFFYAMNTFVTSKALSEEVVDLNYYQYYNEAIHSSKSRKLYIAKMLEKDCKIKVSELNRDMFFKDLRPTIEDGMYNANKCEGLEMEGKKKLIEYLQSERLISFFK